MRFVFLFLVLIVLEVWSIIKIGQLIGVLAVLVLLVAGFIFGTQVIRAQGIASLLQSVRQMHGGKSPMAVIAGGLVNVLAGILLIVPGFISDVIAVLLLLPFVRSALVTRMLSKGNVMTFAANKFGAGFGRMGGMNAANDNARGNVYEHEGKATAASAKPVNNLGRQEDVIEGEIIEDKTDKK